MARQVFGDTALDLRDLGVVEVSRKLSSLHIVWVKRSLSGEYRGWQSFFHFHLKRAFLAEPVNRVFGLSNVSKITLRRFPPFYRAVLTAWYATGGTQAFGAWIVPRPNADPLPLTVVTARSVYTILGCIHHQLHCCVAKVRELGIGHVEWPRVWKNLKFLRFSRPTLDTSWLVAHCILPTADRLPGFGMSVDPACHCGATESLIHLFVDCPSAQPLLD